MFADPKYCICCLSFSYFFADYLSLLPFFLYKKCLLIVIGADQDLSGSELICRIQSKSRKYWYNKTCFCLIKVKHTFKEFQRFSRRCKDRYFEGFEEKRFKLFFFARLCKIQIRFVLIWIGNTGKCSVVISLLCVELS